MILGGGVLGMVNVIFFGSRGLCIEMGCGYLASLPSGRGTLGWDGVVQVNIITTKEFLHFIPLHFTPSLHATEHPSGSAKPPSWPLPSHNFLFPDEPCPETSPKAHTRQSTKAPSPKNPASDLSPRNLHRPRPPHPCTRELIDRASDRQLLHFIRGRAGPPPHRNPSVRFYDCGCRALSFANSIRRGS